ncbi:MAG: hypothetical protein R2857_04295 [Vampirovibrionales bacterium]
MITIAVDCMGGDYAPDEIVKGALWGAAEHRVKVLLIGQPSRIEALVAESPYRHVDYEVVEATEVIDMGETPASSIRKKKDASINVATRCVGEGRAQGWWLPVIPGRPWPVPFLTWAASRVLIALPLPCICRRLAGRFWWWMPEPMPTACPKCCCSLPGWAAFSTRPFTG